MKTEQKRKTFKEGEENIIIFFVIRVIKTFCVLPGRYLVVVGAVVFVVLVIVTKRENMLCMFFIYFTLCSEIMIKIYNMLVVYCTVLNCYVRLYLPGKGNGNPFVIIAL